MRKTTTIFLLLAAAGLLGCPTSSAHDSGPVTGHDSGPPGVDTGVDSGPATGMDSGPVTGTDVPIASVVDASASDHPADSAIIHVTGNLVALSPRLFVSQSTSSMRCLFEIWVGTSAGGDHSGIEVTESFLPTGTNTCFTEPAHIIPDTIMIGDAVTNLTGKFLNYCPSGSSCPANTSQELDVTTGTFTVGASGSDPTATTVDISDIAGTMLSVGPRGMALQGALVTIQNAVIAPESASVHGAPSATNHNVMTVSATGTTTPVIHIQVSKYPGVGCQRTQLIGAADGTTVGSITGMLQYSFGQWTIQPRRSSDLPSVMCADGGAGAPDAGL